MDRAIPARSVCPIDVPHGSYTAAANGPGVLRHFVTTRLDVVYERAMKRPVQFEQGGPVSAVQSRHCATRLDWHTVEGLWPVAQSMPAFQGGKQGPAMFTSSTTVVASFTCDPGQETAWLAVWSALAEAALNRPDCYAFTALPSATRDGRTAVLSRWQKASDFDAFVRRVGLSWLDDALYCRLLPSRVDYYYGVPETLVEELITATSSPGMCVA